MHTVRVDLTKASAEELTVIERHFQRTETPFSERLQAVRGEQYRRVNRPAAQ